MTREKGHMTTWLFEKCIQDIKAFPEPPKEVVPSNYGETVTYPGWYEALLYLERQLPQVGIVFPTNGTLLGNGNVEKLAKVKTLRLVNISVNALTPETYEAFHGLPKSNLVGIEQAVIKIRALRPDVTLWLSMAQDPTYQSPREVDLFREFWSKYGLVQVNPCQYSNRPGRVPNPPVKHPCRSLWSDLVILWDGRATSCCFTADAQPELLVGDATRQSLMDIWHSKRFNELRRLHGAGRRAELDTCLGCTFA